MDTLKKITIVTLRVTLITVIVSFVSLELLMRQFTTTNADGIIRYRGMAIRPLAVPVTSASSDVADYLANKDNALMRYDARLGWTFPPNFENEQVITNSIGIRSTDEYDLVPPDDVLRIAMFGDSFVAGGEVDNTAMIPRLLENELDACGIDAQVMNFGMFGYGMDQAYLRWQYEGRDYQPDIVIFGFQPENLGRNVNLARPLASVSGLPFTKPRYILEDDGHLALINSPAVQPEDLPDLYQNFDNWELARYEWHYNERFQPHWTDISILYRVFEARQYVELWSTLRLTPDDERVLVGTALIDQFAADVTAAGQQFVILHLPNRPELARYVARDSFGYQFMLDDLETRHPVIHTEDIFSGIDDADWQPNLHYAPLTNLRVAQLTANWLSETVDHIACTTEE